ncbi:MAG: sulfatase [Verrucomicrobiales bacterium]|nr:sulfatase [Verrucomicrobiales bacterium]
MTPTDSPHCSSGVIPAIRSVPDSGILCYNVIIMIRKPFCILLPIALLFFVPFAKAEKPNLVFMIADDCTYLDWEVYGGQAKTPNLNEFAKQGVKFTRCFQAAPMCSPTRHNIYTGIYPVKSGAWPNHTMVYPGTKSIAHYLKDGGYRVALSGKTHIAPRESFPFEYSNDFKANDPAAENPYPKLDSLITESKENGNPFCLFACSNEPHTPYTMGDPSAYPPESLKLPPSWVDTGKTREAYSKYLAEITYYDAQCGALLDLIEKHGLSDNTLVFIVSEQGSGFPFAKWTCFELGLTSGMLARWPGKIAPGTTSDALVEYVDVAPTFLDAAGLSVPDTMDGKSFLKVLTGEAKEHKTYTYGIQTTRGIINGSKNFGIRSCGTKTHRYIRNLNPDTKFTNAVTRAGGDKINFWESWVTKAQAGDNHAEAMTRKYSYRPAEELYDVVSDPHCLNNLIEAAELAEVKSELSAELDRWMESQGDKGLETEALALTRSAKNGKKKGGNKGNKGNKGAKKQ